MALWVSLTDWNGQGSPFTAGVPFVGARNYTRLFTEDGLARQDFMTSIRNNLYYVVIVVPLQTVLALGLALVVNNRLLKGRTFFRTAFYFPSVTSSVAISVVFLFLFANSGAVNALLALLRHRRSAVVRRSRGRAPPAARRIGWSTRTRRPPR